jgi:dihydrofolate reductase
MTRLRVACFSVSADGFGAGPAQSMEHPLGIGGMRLHDWFLETASFRASHGGEGGSSTGVDADFARAGMENIGAWILGRNMFGPQRGKWTDDHWKGWWGDNPPYHVPVYVLSHHPRPPIEMAGGTTFYFVAGGIYEALSLAKGAAADHDVRLGGGVAVVRQYLEAGLVDEMHLAIAPVLLGKGESLLAGIDLPKLGYRVTRHVPGEGATHLVISHGH